jgi:PPOX class probable F420-dependent enzyme
VTDHPRGIGPGIPEPARAESIRGWTPGSSGTGTPSVASVDTQQMRQLVENARIAHLATVGDDGQPHLVPVCFVLIEEVAYTAVDHKPKRNARLRRLANIEATGRACLLVDEYEDDWSKLWWVRLDCRGQLVHDPGESVRGITALVGKYEQYADRPPAGPVVALDVLRWSGWSAA